MDEWVGGWVGGLVEGSEKAQMYTSPPSVLVPRFQWTALITWSKSSNPPQSLCLLVQAAAELSSLIVWRLPPPTFTTITPLISWETMGGGHKVRTVGIPIHHSIQYTHTRQHTFTRTHTHPSHTQVDSNHRHRDFVKSSIKRRAADVDSFLMASYIFYFWCEINVRPVILTFDL